MKIKWHKLQVWDHRITARWLGGPMAGLTLALSVVSYPTHAFNYDSVPLPIENKEMVMTTGEAFALPVAQLTGISQGYHLLHYGVDLRAPKGTAVVAMSSGTVIEVKQMVVGYGHFVRIAHDGTLSSLYAHLDKVWVVPGQKMAKGADVGTVGTTGWSTGPHLHFEVFEGNKPVNPTRYIGNKI